MTFRDARDDGEGCRGVIANYRGLREKTKRKRERERERELWMLLGRGFKNRISLFLWSNDVPPRIMNG